MSRVIALLLMCVCVALDTGSAAAQQQSSAREPVIIADLPAYRIALDPDQRVLNLILPLTHYERVRQKSEIERSDARALTRMLYEHFDDAFDFILFAFDRRQPWVGDDTLAGLNMRTRIMASGLGMDPRPPDTTFGPVSRLASVTFMKTADELVSGLALHELVHTWGQNVLITDKPMHWGRTSVGGQLGGWQRGQLTRARDGVYVPRGNQLGWPSHQFDANLALHRVYADLELYLMGLIPADSVGDIEVAVNAYPVPDRGAAFIASRFDTITIASITARHGPRIPSWPDAQRTFRGLFVIVSFLPIPAAELARASEHARLFALAGPERTLRAPNFWEATGGRATLQLDDLRAAMLPMPRTELLRRAAAAEREACAAALTDSLTLMQRTVLDAVPRVQLFPASDTPSGALAGYRFAHGYSVVRKMGLVLVNPRAVAPMPHTLFYMPSDTSGRRDWTDFFTPDGPYTLVGWGYAVQDRSGTAAPPRQACIPGEEWFVREAGWQLFDGSVLPTPGVATAPPRPPGRRDLYYWRPRTLDVHLWLDAAGVPVLARENPRAPDRGIVLPTDVFPPRVRRE